MADQPKGLEEDFKHDDNSGTSDEQYERRVRWMASILHDAFDGHAPGTNNPNDGCHFTRPGAGLVWEGDLNTWDDGDEPFALDGSSLRELFVYWTNNGIFLDFENFLGGLAQLLQEDGHAWQTSATCSKRMTHKACAQATSTNEQAEPRAHSRGL